ncbi:MAG: hypothetical protein KC543_10290 [Myxococcales bacterium]|nr:hypothetical protein [Myxococcales bacterium]
MPRPNLPTSRATATARPASLALTMLCVAAIAAGCASTQPQATGGSTTPLEPRATVPIPNARQVDPNLLVGGQPSAAALRTAAAAGYTTDISLRTAGEPGSENEPAEARSAGLRFVSIPVAGADDLTVANAKALGAAMASSEGKVLLHCASGNRASALLGLKAFVVDGVDMAAALQLARDAGIGSLEPALEARMRALCAEGVGSCPAAP